MKRISQAGDTLIEVLIAIAIAGSVLAGAYVSSNRSSQQVRSAQEFTEAQKITGSAVELLSAVVKSKPISLDPAATVTPFCVDGTSPYKITGGNVLPSVDADDFSQYVAQCKKTLGGVTYYTAIERLSSLTTDSAPPVSKAKTFIVHTRWDRIGGGRQEVSTSYVVRED